MYVMFISMYYRREAATECECVRGGQQREGQEHPQPRGLQVLFRLDDAPTDIR